jgi:hypothetical protein
MRLVPDWRLAWRFWSVRLNALGTFVLGLFLIWPESLLAMWSLVPPEAREVLPPRIVLFVPLALFVAATVARVVKQRKLDAQQPQL